MRREEVIRKNIKTREAMHQIRFFSIVFALIIWTMMIICPLCANAGTPYADNGRLAVRSGQIVNKNGKAFTIKGVSTHGLAWFPEYVNEASFRTLRDQWGVNTIRLAVYTGEYGGYCTGGSRSALKKLVRKGVSCAAKLGMYVIIDWHILNDGNPLTYQKSAKAFFKEMAAAYSSRGNVMFEICNEPNGSGGTWENIKKYAQNVIRTIRAQNKKAIIIVGTPTWSQDVECPQNDPIGGYANIAYAFHFYAGTHQEEMRNRLENVLRSGLPVIVTEFGISQASGSGGVYQSEGTKWMKLLDRYHVGRVCWNLSNKNESSALLKPSCRKTGNWKKSDLSKAGKWLIKTYNG